MSSLVFSPALPHRRTRARLPCTRALVFNVTSFCRALVLNVTSFCRALTSSPCGALTVPSPSRASIIAAHAPASFRSSAVPASSPCTHPRPCLALARLLKRAAESYAFVPGRVPSPWSSKPLISLYCANWPVTSNVSNMMLPSS